ncbi:Uncharacterized protein APZ42_031026 [Daphnia magna]|uniref:Uncharacterized protein n=1 Tax=Daphnia magna TaxID=35525 RepID=A0A0P6FFX2_9CRUS|nr:Uncharacterized protein APZ42_031026 [Daphnia magna]
MAGGSIPISRGHIFSAIFDPSLHFKKCVMTSFPATSGLQQSYGCPCSFFLPRDLSG